MFAGRHPEDKETWLVYQEVKLFLVLTQDDSSLILELTILCYMLFALTLKMSLLLQIEKNLRNSKEAFGDVQLFKIFERKTATYFAQVCIEFHF